jgi:hypothetical protein
VNFVSIVPCANFSGRTLDKVNYIEMINIIIVYFVIIHVNTISKYINYIYYIIFNLQRHRKSTLKLERKKQRECEKDSRNLKKMDVSFQA